MRHDRRAGRTSRSSAAASPGWRWRPALKRGGRDDFVILERAREVGGTWRDNTYPGCACDVPSHLYSFSFAPNPEWSSTFSPQPEISAYLRKRRRRRGPARRTSASAARSRTPLGRRTRSAGGSRPRRARSARESLDRRRRPAQRAEAPRHPRAARLRGPRLPLGQLGPRSRSDRRARRRRSAPGRARSSSSREIQPEVEKLHLFQRTAPWVMPRRAPAADRTRARALPARPGGPAADARGDLLGPRGFRDPDAARALSPGSPERSAERTCAARSPTRSCARSSRPTTRRAASAS